MLKCVELPTPPCGTAILRCRQYLCRRSKHRSHGIRSSPNSISSSLSFTSTPISNSDNDLISFWLIRLIAVYCHCSISADRLKPLQFDQILSVPDILEATKIDLKSTVELEARSCPILLPSCHRQDAGYCPVRHIATPRVYDTLLTQTDVRHHLDHNNLQPA